MLKLLALDTFTILLFVMVLLASLFPVSGQIAVYFGHFTTAAIAILFFLHGAKISRQAMLQGIMHWKLHSLIFAFTFMLFPIIGLVAKPVIQPILGQELYWGFLFLCFLPSTVQSSIAFTSMAKGNVAGAICSASFSNMIGMMITPILVGLFISQNQSNQEFNAMDSIVKITTLLLVPFILGQIMQKWMTPILKSKPKLIKAFDQGSILMVVYGAFSSAVVSGLWQEVSGKTLLWIVIFCCILLAIVMLLALYVAKFLGFNLEDQKTIFFCSSKKTLASGVPMAQILFAGQPLGMLILPIMIFHQIQLMVCGIIANKWGKDIADES